MLSLFKSADEKLTTDAWKSEVNRLRAKKEQLEEKKARSKSAHETALTSRREALLAGTDANGSAAKLENAAQELAGLNDAITILEDAIDSAEHSLTLAYERENRQRLSKEKLALSDSLSNARREFLATAPTYQKVLRTVPGTLTEAPGLAELLDQFMVAEKNAMAPLLDTLRREARLLSDENVSMSTLRDVGLYPRLPITPQPVIKPDRAFIRYMDPRADVPHAIGVGGFIDDGNPLLNLPPKSKTTTPKTAEPPAADENYRKNEPKKTMTVDTQKAGV
jgi:hypothetical protein